MEDFINILQGNMSVEEYSLKFTMWSRCASSLVYNSRNEMSRLVTSVDDIVKEENRMDMIQNDMNLSRLIVYAQSIEKSKLSRIAKKLEMIGPNKQY